MARLGDLHTSKTPDETRRDIREVFRKWGVQDFDILPAPKGLTVARVEWWIGQRKQEISCSRFYTYYQNLRAVYSILHALRLAADRGIMEELARAATAMLPPGKIERRPHEVLGVASDAPLVVAEAVYRTLAKQAHPDAGGNDERMQELNKAIEAFRVTAGEKDAQT